MVVTSPNAGYIPEILDPSMEVKLCADLRYGPDDATLWPQPYLDNYPYLSVILRLTQDPHSQRNVMWWLPKASDFEQSNTAMGKGVGTLTGTEMDSLKEQVRLLLKWVRDYRNGDSFSQDVAREILWELYDLNSCSDLNADQACQLETAVAAYYCQTFYNVCHRTPITPDRLK